MSDPSPSSNVPPSRRMRVELIVLAVAIAVIVVVGTITLMQHRRLVPPDNTMVDPGTYHRGQTTTPQVAPR